MKTNFETSFELLYILFGDEACRVFFDQSVGDKDCYKTYHKHNRSLVEQIHSSIQENLKRRTHVPIPEEAIEPYFDKVIIVENVPFTVKFTKKSSSKSGYVYVVFKKI